jgi:hypothetical protein
MASARRQRGKFSLEASLAALPADERAAAGALREALLSSVREFGPQYTVRDDSRLAYDYLRGDGDAATMSLEQLTAELIVAQYLHASTGYRQLWSEDMKTIAKVYKQRFPNISWARLWTILRETMDPCLKLEALLRNGLSFPEKLQAGGVQ